MKDFPHCTGPCQQGDKPCPCPQSCEAPEDFNGLEVVAKLVIWFLALVGAGVLVGYFV
jgi:hypothetical protein